MEISLTLVGILLIVFPLGFFSGVGYVAWTIQKSNRNVNRGAHSILTVLTDSSMVHQGVYTNWKGEKRVRRFKPLYIYFGSSKWHKEPQWLLEATDVDNGEERTFSLDGFVTRDTGG